MDPIELYFGAKKAKKSPKKSVKKVTEVAKVMINGRVRTVYRGKRGGLFYRSKGEKVYVDKSRMRKLKKSPKKMKKSPKKGKKSPKKSPKKGKKSPKRGKKSPKKGKKMRYGIGLGQPDLMNLMSPTLSSAQMSSLFA